MGVDESTVRGWKKNQSKLNKFVEDKKGRVRDVRRIGSGKKAAFPILEQKLFEWVTDRNVKGLRVKDKFIVARAKAIREEMVAELSSNDSEENKRQAGELNKFAVSHSWCMRFKNRFELVVRRHTTTRNLPEDFAEKARDFIREVQDLITIHRISRRRIVNFDQVPRYFETENNATVIKKGSREVFLRKASTSHKRFTFTPVISAAGDFLALHLLFSNLKNCPKVSPGCIVDVNKTGMWNETVTARIIDLVVKKCQTPFREPTLIMLDAYGTHVKFVQDKGQLYQQKNVFLKIIPGKMTGLLQPLDVAINRSFQQQYNDHYNDHLALAINSTDPKARTKSGNVKMPRYEQVSDWILEWSKDQSAEKISKAFDVCGLVPADDFSLEKLHKPLRDCFAEDFSLAEWENEHHQVWSENENSSNNDDDSRSVKIYTEAFSMFEALFEMIGNDGNYDAWLRKTKKEVKKHIIQDELLNGLFTEEERKLFDSGMPTGSAIEFSASANVLKIKLKIVEVDKDVNIISEKLYDCVDGTSTIELAMFEDHFGIFENIE